ncbi:hypothetical protein D7Y41_19305 [Anaerotruncus sp. 1XD22-93]|nr:hypothetical protein [Lachnospiraceae bacterium]NBI75968.1 hypothetical protein [Lachnospiraceae bacterium]RKJ87048.1 hypothetical protein D7Y41_19305 [Anaerotruncus sp. 1XD22-93]
MESMRDIDRVMEREIAKGSCPLRFVKIDFGVSPYQQIASKEKLLEVLSYLLRIGDYGRFAGKGTGNNVYMDIKGRKPTFKRTRSFIDRNNIFVTIRRYGKKIKPDFDGHTYLETVQCIFELPEEEQEKYRVTYDGQETFAFPMSDKYILGLYTYCISARQTAGDIPGTDFSEIEQGIVKLESVRDVLFQCLLFDNIKYGEGVLCADLCTIYCLKENG